MFAPIAWSGASMDEAGWATHGHDVAVECGRNWLYFAA
jgi:hypothetical protein